MAVDAVLKAVLVRSEYRHGASRVSVRSGTKCAGFEKYWHFCRTDFRYDEWLCRICDRFSLSTDPSARPILYRKRQAVEHEKTPEHKGCLERFHSFLDGYPELLEKNRRCEMGQSPGAGDPLSSDQVYNHLMMEMPNARKGINYVNQFVAFWMHDVAIALEEEPESASEQLDGLTPDNGTGQSRNNGERALQALQMAQHRHRRRTFEEFLEGIVNELDTWGSNNAYGDDGWGIDDGWGGADGWGGGDGWADRDGWGGDDGWADVVDVKEGKRAENIAVSDGDGWVIQKGRDKGRGGRGGRGRGGGGSGPQQGGSRRQRQTKKYDHRGENKPSKNDQVRQNQFSQLRVDDT